MLKSVRSPSHRADSTDNDNNAGDLHRAGFAAGPVALAGSVELFDENGASVGTFGTIQAAIDAAGEDYSIVVGAGTYNENLTVDVNGLTIQGLPGAILEGSFLTDNSVTGPLNEWFKTSTAYDGGAGVGVTIAADGVTIEGLTITAFLQGVLLGDGSDGTTLDGVTLISNFAGIHKPGSAAVTDFTMLGGSIGDGHLGMDIVRDPGSGGIFDTVLIDGTSFADLNRKGIYVEALSNAVITGFTMTNVGEFGGIVPTGALGAGGNGINLNLKYGDYENVTISDFTMTNVGSSDRDGAVAEGHQNGGAIVVEARDDAPSYSGNPATLTNVTIENGSIDGTSTGIQLGEPGKQNLTPDVTVENVTITDAQHTLRHGDVGNQSGAVMTFEGTAGDDSLVVSGNSDGAFIIHAGGGADSVTTGSASDTIEGGADDDVIDGAGGIDTAIVGSGAVFTANGSNWTVASSAGTDTLTNIEIVSTGAGPKVLLVGSGGFATIQAAIDAASDGDTILIAAGTYTENVNFNKAVTVLGAHAGDPGSSRVGADATGETTLIGRHDITATTGAVVIDGLRFVNNASTTNGGPGDPLLQIVSGQDHVVTNSVFYSEVAGGARPSPDDRAISMPVIADGTITISDNYFTGASAGGFGTASWGRAIWFDGGGADLVVTGNTIEYARTGLNLDLTGDSAVTVEGNLFTTTGTAMAVGVDTVGLTVTANDFVNAGEEFNFRNQTDDVSFDAATAVDSQTGDFIDVLGGSGDDDLRGTDFNDLLDGNQLLPANADNDMLDGRGGNDILLGRAGDDTLIGGTGNDLLDGGTGIDTARFSGALTFADTFLGWIVTSSDGTDILQNVEIAVAGSGQRTLLVGASGFTSLQPALTAAQTGDIVRLAGGTHSGTVNFSVGGLTVIAQPGAVQNLTYNDTGGFGITVVAANSADTITTGAGNDLIVGGGGVDTLNGGAGNDVIYGEGGIDTAIGGLGDDIYIVDTSTDIVLEAIGEGNDSVLTQVSYLLTSGADVELLSTTFHGGTADIELTGNYGNQTIIGNAGNNVITGGVGADVLVGLAGNDTYIVHDAQAVVIEDAGGGNDTVFASVSYALAADAVVETLSSTFHGGTGALDLAGSNSGQTIFGNNGSNTLDGKGGADTLVGLGGADMFAFSSALGAGNVDVVADFEQGVDKVALDDAIFTAAGPTGALNANAFVVGNAAADASDRIIYDSATGALFYDADGNGAGAAVQFATLSPGLALAASDFVIF